MLLTRRNFVRLGCVSATALAGTYLLGCSSGSAGTVSGATSEEASEIGSSLVRKDETEGASKMEETETAESATSADEAAEQETTESTDEVVDEAAPTEEAVEEESAASTDAESAAVVFFSVTGNTEAVAEKVAQSTGAPLLRVLPAEPYTSADIDYNSDCRANREQDSVTDRPALDASVPDVSGYDTIYLGYPIWWGKVPRVMLTFLESVDLAGKTVISLCTSGSSSISGSLDEVHAAVPSTNWQDGQRFDSGVSQADIDSWVASF